MGESFTSYLRDLFSELGPVSLRRMFGGQGLYHEGVIIGLISWLAAVLLSIPLAIAISRAVGEALLSNPLDFAFSISGTLIWFGIVVGVAALASLMPARSATRVSVREVLAYE